MKSFIWTLLFMCTTLAVCAQHALVIKGNITDKATDRPLKKIRIKVTGRDQRLVLKTKTDTAGNYAFSLSTEQSDIYTIKVAKRGYVAKYFTVSTENIPDDQRGTKFPAIEAGLRLFKPVKGVDYSALKQPLNKYYYDPVKDNYLYDKTYLQRSFQLMQEIEEKEKAKTGK